MAKETVNESISRMQMNAIQRYQDTIERLTIINASLKEENQSLLQDNWELKQALFQAYAIVNRLKNNAAHA